jgi:hypothetical protein
MRCCLVCLGVGERTDRPWSSGSVKMVCCTLCSSTYSQWAPQWEHVIDECSSVLRRWNQFPGMRVCGNKDGHRAYAYRNCGNPSAARCRGKAFLRLLRDVEDGGNTWRGILGSPGVPRRPTRLYAGFPGRCGPVESLSTDPDAPHRLATHRPVLGPFADRVVCLLGLPKAFHPVTDTSLRRDWE